MCTTKRTKTAKIDITIRKEIKKHGLIIDRYGNIFKLPYVDEAHRKHKIKPIKPFYHTGYTAITINQKIIDLNKVLQECKEVDYKMRFEILFKNIPSNYKPII